jgi:hypothetical protein
MFARQSGGMELALSFVKRTLAFSLSGVHF